MTAWGAYGLAEIWEMVRDEDLSGHDEHVRHWQTMSAVCEHYADRLRDAAEVLAERWPPQRNEAGAAFVARLTGFADTVAAASAKAQLNSTAMTLLTGCLSDARQRVSALRRQGLEYAEAEGVRITAARLASLVPLDGMDDAQVLHAARSRGLAEQLARVHIPDVPVGWREDLDAQARTVMADTDRAVTEARAYLRVHVTFDLKAGDPERPAGGGPETGGSGRPPVPTFDPPPPRPFTATPKPARTPDGPILTGGGRPTPPSGPATPSWPSAPPAPDNVQGPGLPAPAPALGTVRGLAGWTSRPAAAFAWPAAPTTTAASPLAPTRARPAAATTPSHPTPILDGAGMARAGFGGTGAAHSATGLSRSGNSGVGKASGSSEPGTARGAEGQWTEGTDDWGLRRGGAPVIEPSPEPTSHDPGPGVIGHR